MGSPTTLRTEKQEESIWETENSLNTETSRNMEHHLKNMEVVLDKTLQYKLQDWTLSTETIIPPDSCVRGRNSDTPSKRVKFDSTLFLARVDLRRWRSAPTSWLHPWPCDRGKFKDNWPLYGAQLTDAGPSSWECVCNVSTAYSPHWLYDSQCSSCIFPQTIRKTFH